MDIILYWINWIVFGCAVALAIIVWYKRWQHYKNLPLHERLWEDYICTKGKEPALSIAENKLSDYICRMLETAESSNALDSLYNKLARYRRNRPFAFDGVCGYGPFCTEEMQACLVKKNDEFAEQRKEAHKKGEEAETKKEAARFKAAQEATTLEAAQKILIGHSLGTPSAELAIQKMNRFSLDEVLSAKTLDELEKARNRARGGSLAMKFVPFMYEKIVKSMMEQADNIDDLIAAAELSPHEAIQKDTALYMAFLKLRAGLKN